MAHKHHLILRKLFAAKGLELVLTCPAYPEQYEVFKGVVQVAYLRLRHRYFYVSVPDHTGAKIYECEPQGNSSFNNDERLKYMAIALRNIIDRIS